MEDHDSPGSSGNTMACLKAIHFIITDLRSCIDKKGVVSAEVFLLEDNLQTTEWKVYLTTHVRSKVGIPNFTTQYDFAQ